jgi:hypothetical protein
MTAHTDSGGLRFVTIGVVAVWHHDARQLQIDEHTYWVVPEVLVGGVGPDVRVQVSGYRAEDGRRIVTRLTLG